MSEKKKKLSKLEIKKQQLENAKVGDEIGTYGVFMGDRGVYDTRNKLNDMTGKEWTFFTNSVWITGYSPTAKENIGLKYRKIHPSPKPPGLIKDIVNFFTKENEVIFDPFAGVGGSLLGAALANGNRMAYGIELQEKYIDAYRKVCEKENLQEMVMIHGDSLKIDEYEELNAVEFDLIIADPPYSDMMNRDRTGQRKKYGNGDATPYSDNQNDLGNQEYNIFNESLKLIIEKSVSKLKKGKYLILFCKDFQPTSKNANLIHADIINLINEIEGINYKGMRIWHDQAMSLFPFGYPYSFVMNQLHQYILVFRKEQ
jgi:DNA modification methylase